MPWQSGPTKPYKIGLAFRKAELSSEFISKFISFYTGLLPCNWGTKGYSHVELIFEQGGGPAGWDHNHPVAFSSTTFGTKWGGGKCNGPRFLDAKDLMVSPEKWDIATLFVNHMNYVAMWSEACSIHDEGGKYDFGGLLGFAAIPFFESKENWYCSEVVDHLLYAGEIFRKYHRPISPRRLSKILRRMGCNFSSGEKSWLPSLF